MNQNKFKLIEEAGKIGDFIWEEVVTWSPFERDTIGKQLVRAADSISANLSEAQGRYTFQDRKKFAIYSRGSLCETLDWINKAYNRKLINEEKTAAIMNEMTLLHKRLNAYIRYLTSP